MPRDMKKHYYHKSEHKEASDAEQKSAWLTDLVASLSQIHICWNQKFILKELGFPFLYSGYPLFILIQWLNNTPTLQSFYYHPH